MDSGLSYGITARMPLNAISIYAMTSLSFEDKTNPAVYLTIIILPFLMLYWMLPFVTDLTLGMDYQEFSIQNQMELLFSLKTGSFPLYVPGYALGHSSSSLTLGQIYHPLPHIASILPGYWDGKALEWNTFLKLLTLGLTHLALFVFLRKIGLNTIFSFLLSVITTYNMRTLDLFRFGASMEAFTGHLLLCAAIGWYFLKPSKWIGPLSIIGATYWLVNSGLPREMYYGLLGAGFFTLVAPFFISDMRQNKQINLKKVQKFWIKTGTYVTIGILLSSAYVLPFYFDFLKSNALRVAQGYEFSVSPETFFGTLSNFFMPFYSSVHGAFGGSSLIIMAAIVPLLRLFKIKIPGYIWAIWGIVLFTFLYMQGARTPVHRWAWEYLPFAKSMRNEGRISLIMPIFIMMLLAWVVKIKPVSVRLRKFTVELTPYMLLVLIGFMLIPVYILISLSGLMELGGFTPQYIRSIPLWLIISFFLFGFVPPVILFLYGAYPRAARVLGILLCVVTCVQIGGFFKYGTFIVQRNDKPTFEQMKSQKKIKLDYPYNPGAGMYSSVVLDQLDRSFIEPFPGKLYTEIIPVSGRDEAYDRMERERLPQQVFIEGYDPGRAKTISDEGTHVKEGTVDMVYSSFNLLKFKASAPSPAFIGISYPYTGHWKARVNGHEVPVYRANGAAHAVEIPSGASLIEFRYFSSSAFWGMIISFSTFTLIGLFACFRNLNGIPRVIMAVCVLITGIGGAILWNNSLYTGDNLGTEYSWTYSPPGTEHNLAYGKKTSVFPLPEDSIYFAKYFYYTHRSRVVDGYRRPDEGYIVKLSEQPNSVTLDLHDNREINSIVLYESMEAAPANNRHLEISVSLDEKKWNKVKSITSEVNSNQPIRVDFDSSKTARYVQVTVSGSGSLSLDELEVY